jgi:2-oxoglutarate ferredoxin oxidoreductase subunit alpha
MLHFSEVFPLPLRDRFDYVKLLERAKLAICIENNASGQFSRLVHSETGFGFKAHIRKFDGRPFSVEELIGEINGRLGKL